MVRVRAALVSFDGSQGLALCDEDGSSLVIHENAADHLTQPIGGACVRDNSPRLTKPGAVRREVFRRFAPSGLSYIG